MEQDIVRENARRMARHITIVRDNIISRACADRKITPHGQYCESTLFVGAVTTEVQIQNDECYVTLPVQGHLTRQVNIIPLKERLKKIAGDNPHIAPCNHKLVSYSENNLTVLGTAKLHVKSKSDADQELTFHVVETNQPGLLVLRSSQTLGLIKVVVMTKKEEEQTIPDDSSQTATASQELREEVIKQYAPH